MPEVKAPQPKSKTVSSTTEADIVIKDARKTAINIPDPVQALYKKLSSPIPEEFLVSYKEDNKEFTGYHAQYAINLLNQEVGLGGWFTKEKILKEELIGKAWVVAMFLQVIISVNKEHLIVSGYGASFARRIENAYKGAKTSAFKNACRYLGIGNELYLKGFEDGIIEELTYEKVEEEPISEELVELEKKINEAKNVEQLTSLEKKILDIEGKSVKAILFKKFNEKKLILNK